MADEARQDGETPEQEEEHEEHPLPKGALVMTLAFLVLITLLWTQVYLQLLTSGGIPRP
ncbi:MAG TPA: hypothetical protein VNL77_09685 [Roseiflexaceae bacterium]|nr:hypothetical protein [Roseiflexaceae bacterium]